MRRDTCPVCEQRAPVTDGVIGHHESEGRSCRGAGRTAAEAPVPREDAPRPAEENRTRTAAPLSAALGLVGLLLLALGAVPGSVPLMAGGAVILVAAGAAVLLNRRAPADGHGAARAAAGERTAEQRGAEEAVVAHAEPEPRAEPTAELRQEAVHDEERKGSVSGSVRVETVSVEETAPERLSVGGLFISGPADSAPQPDRSDREESRDAAPRTPEPERDFREPEARDDEPEARDDGFPTPETRAPETPEPRAEESASPVEETEKPAPEAEPPAEIPAPRTEKAAPATEEAVGGTEDAGDTEASVGNGSPEPAEAPAAPGTENTAEDTAPLTPEPEPEPERTAGSAGETAPPAPTAVEPSTEPGRTADRTSEAPAARVVKQAAPAAEETEASEPEQEAAEPAGGPLARQAEAAGMDAETLREIAQAVVTEQNASMVYVQQRFSLSRTAARRALDALERLEVVSAPAKNGRRRALTTSLDHLTPVGKR